MILHVKINVNHPLLDDLACGSEVADTLRIIADNLEGYERADFAPSKTPVSDANGNIVGVQIIAGD